MPLGQHCWWLTETASCSTVTGLVCSVMYGERASAAEALSQKTHAETDCKNKLHIAAHTNTCKHTPAEVMKNTETINVTWCNQCQITV